MAYKHDYDKILTRLTHILAKLNDGEALSVKALAEEFNTSQRTIQRDFNERLTSFPIYQEDKKWKMQDEFRLEKMTSLEDTVVLDIMEGLLDGSSGVFSLKAKRLLSKIKNKSLNPIYAKLDIEDISDKLKEVQELEIAIRDKHLITCSYIIKEDKKSLSLKPLKIANYEGFWYLIALDGKDDMLKKYYLKNITAIKLQKTHFETNTKLDTLLENAISIWFSDEVEPYAVTLHIAADIAKYLRRKPISKSQKILSSFDDGSMDISIMITDDMEIIPIVKYWLPHIRIVKPLSIKEQVEEDIRGYLALS